ncbi:hypothetical protein Misp04_39210 [Micromonospora sp. NBRC 101691]|nr:hypothetical protein Misp04_39210 [Micromonospora sp. NBRC 101691]
MVVFGLGGTIGMCRTDGGAVAPALSAQQLVDAVPGLAATGIEIEVTDFAAAPGASLTFADLTELAAAAKPGAGGRRRGHPGNRHDRRDRLRLADA